MDPSSLVPLAGNVPEWVAGAASLIALRRSRRAEQYFEELQAIGLTAERLKAVVEQSEQLGDLLLEGVATAAECPDDQRRRLLALAFVGGIDGDVAIDDVQFFTRTMRQVDPIHMKLLQAIAQHGQVSTLQLENIWPEATSMFKPMRALLDREGLIEDVSLASMGNMAAGAWLLTDYGHRFLEFIVGSEVEFDWLPGPE